TVAQRNERVFRRYAKLADGSSIDVPTLTIPAGVVITPLLVAALPRPVGTWHLIWDPEQAPIVWQRLGRDASSAPFTLVLPDEAALDVSTAARRRRSAWRLLRASGKPTDGWLSRHVHRRISRLGTWLLLGLGLT